MGFSTETTPGLRVTKSQQRYIDRSMDLNFMVSFLGVCLDAQVHQNGGLDGHVETQFSSHGAQRDITLNHILKEVHPDTRVWLESKQT